MQYTALLDVFSAASLLVLFVLSIVMFRHHYSPPRHAFVLAGLCGVVMASWIVADTLYLTTYPLGLTADLTTAAILPLSVVAGLAVPMWILLFVGVWHMLTSRCQAQSLRPVTYVIHWIIVLGWVTISLLEPTSNFATKDALSDLAPAERVAVYRQYLAAVRPHDRASLAYVVLVMALFFLPLLLSVRRKT